MKKAYSKPMIAVESFHLDAAVAASCSQQGLTPLGFSEEKQCQVAGFFNNYCYIDYITPGADGTDEFCYHGPQLMFINS